MPGGIDLTIVIPAYNEAGRLGGALARLRVALDPHSTEVLVVDDGSTDDTADVARVGLAKFPLGRLIRLPVNSGKGAAVRAGIQEAQGSVVVYMDADLATDPGDLRPLLDALDHSDVAIGSRAVQGTVIQGAGRKRVLMGQVFNAVARRVIGAPHRDTQCGFKGFRAPVAKALFGQAKVDGFAFDVEILLLAHRMGLQVVEIPVHWTAVPGSHVRLLRDPALMLRDALQSRLRWRRIRPLAELGLRLEGAAGTVTHEPVVDVRLEAAQPVPGRAAVRPGLAGAAPAVLMAAALLAPFLRSF